MGIPCTTNPALAAESDVLPDSACGFRWDPGGSWLDGVLRHSDLRATRTFVSHPCGHSSGKACTPRPPVRPLHARHYSTWRPPSRQASTPGNRPGGDRVELAFGVARLPEGRGERAFLAEHFLRHQPADCPVGRWPNIRRYAARIAATAASDSCTSRMRRPSTGGRHTPPSRTQPTAEMARGPSRGSCLRRGRTRAGIKTSSASCESSSRPGTAVSSTSTPTRVTCPSRAPRLVVCRRLLTPVSGQS